MFELGIDFASLFPVFGIYAGNLLRIRPTLCSLFSCRTSRMMQPPPSLSTWSFISRRWCRPFASLGNPRVPGQSQHPSSSSLRFPSLPPSRPPPLFVSIMLEVLTHIRLVCDPSEDGGDNGNVHEADSGGSGCKSEVAMAGLLHRCASS